MDMERANPYHAARGQPGLGEPSDVKLSIRCDGCGNQFSIAADTSKSRVDCPDCGLSCKVKLRGKKRAGIGDPTPLVREPLNGEDDHYIARRAGTNAQPVFRQWDTGPTLTHRVRLFLLTQFLIYMLLISGIVSPELPWGGDTMGMLVPAVCGSVLLLILLGTFDRTSLYRNSLGDIHLIKKWRVGFIPASFYDVPLAKYDRVRMSAVNGAETGDWLIMIALLVLAIVPGVVWYVRVMARPTYRVILCGGARDDEIIYRGQDRKHAEELGRSISEMTDKKFDRV